MNNSPLFYLFYWYNNIDQKIWNFHNEKIVYLSTTLNDSNSFHKIYEYIFNLIWSIRLWMWIKTIMLNWSKSNIL